MATRISKNFALEEFTASATAKAKGIANVPNTHQVANICALVHNVLQPLRDVMGEEIKIGSGYRCPQLNKAVGGLNGSRATASLTSLSGSITPKVATGCMCPSAPTARTGSESLTTC